MQQFLIAAAAGYVAGAGIMKSIMESKSLASMFASTGLGPNELALVGGGAIYALKPLPEGVNALVSGFLIGAAVKGYTAA